MNSGLRWFIWRFNQYKSGFLEGDFQWATLRLWVVFFASILICLLGLLIEYWFSSISQTPEQGAVIALVKFWNIIRFLIVPVTCLIMAISVAAQYIQDIYEFDNYGVAVNYLLASLFGIGYPQLRIENGGKKLKPGEVNTLAVIGGPGYVLISPGNVVLFERLTHPSEVRAEGLHFISRFESIKEIIELSDQHGFIEQSTPMTKDGILVRVSDIHFRYRLWGGHRWGGMPGRSPLKPYPFSIAAVRDQVYKRTIRNGSLADWNAMVQNAFDGQIYHYIREHKLDEIISPESKDVDPREEIVRKINSSGLRGVMKSLGAELVWFDIGHFGYEDPNVEEQRIAAWQAEWIGDAEVRRAYGEAKRQVAQEIARAEVQAQVVMAIAHSMAELGVNKNLDRSSLANLFLMKTTQILESLGDSYKND